MVRKFSRTENLVNFPKVALFMANFHDITHREALNPGSTSASLLHRMSKGSQKDWERFVSLYYPFVFLCCRRCQFPAQDAADIAQEVFQAVFLNFQKSELDKRNFRGWLTGVVRHKIQDYWRKTTNQVNGVGGSSALVRINQVVDPLDDEEITQQGKSLLLARALDLVREEFEETTWQVAKAQLIEQFPAKEIAKEFGITQNAAYKAKARVIRRIRDELSELLE